VPNSEYIQVFAGKPVVDWSPEGGISDPEGTIYRIALTWDESEEGEHWTDRFSKFLDDSASSRVTGIIVGNWGGMGEDSSQPVVEALVAAQERLPQLRALFLGEILQEECEISWITQTDVSPLFEAYPDLEYFRVRGGSSLRFGTLRHERLKELGVETGGLSRDAVHEIFTSYLPALEHLELWLGMDNYGADTTVEDFAPLLPGTLFPRLRYLGLRDSEIADEIAAVLAHAPVLEQIRVLDLSLGNLGDVGAAALLESPAVRKLEKLDLHFHYCSADMMTALQGLGIEVDVSDRQEPQNWGDGDHRFVAVGE
jgi:hypothetical protein